MQWIRYTINTTVQAEEIISCELAELGIDGVEIEDRVPLSKADVSKMFIDILPEMGEDDGKSRVSFYLDAACDNSEMLRQVREILEEISVYTDIGEGTITESLTEDKDWMNNWKEFFHAFTIEDILIKPTWEEVPEGLEGKTLVEIDPGISFGTGKHETTQLCIRQISKYLKWGDEVLDIGCGSGILSVVSLKKGARHVTGTDIDEECIRSSEENLEVNGIDASRFDLYCGDLTNDDGIRRKVGSEKYDIAVANILAEVIIPMAGVIPSFLRSGGIFISSGIIDLKENEVVQAIRGSGMQVIGTEHQGEWVSVTAVKVG